LDVDCMEMDECRLNAMARLLWSGESDPAVIGAMSGGWDTVRKTISCQTPVIHSES
jgi:hypothetical protein